VIAKCRKFVAKAPTQLRSRKLTASKARKKRTKLSECQAVLRRAGG